MEKIVWERERSSRSVRGDQIADPRAKLLPETKHLLHIGSTFQWRCLYRHVVCHDPREDSKGERRWERERQRDNRVGGSC